MICRFLLFITSVIFSSLAAYGQIDWEAHYGNAILYTNAKALIKHDSFFIAAAYTSIETGGNDDALIIKTDQTGNLIWRKKIGGAGHERFNDVILVEDGYVFAGETNSIGSGRSDFYIVKTDFEGNTLWERTFGTPDWEVCEVIAALPDGGGFYMAGTSFVDLETKEDWLVMKIDAQGIEQWSAYFGTENPDLPSTINTLSDGHCFVTGEYYGGVTLLKLDQNSGDVIWEDLDDPNPPTTSNYLNEVIELPDSSLVIGGYGFNVTRLNKNGEEIWTTIFPSGEIFTLVRPFAIDTLDSNTLMVAAYTNFSVPRLYEVDLETGEELDKKPIIFNHHRVADVVFEDSLPIILADQFIVQDSSGYQTEDQGLIIMIFDDSLQVEHSYTELHEIPRHKEEADCMSMDPNGNHWLFGIAESEYISQGGSLLLTKVNPTGQLVDQFVLPINPSWNTLKPLDVLASNGGNIFILTQIYVDSVELAAVDHDGQVLWRQNFVATNSSDPGFDQSLLRKHPDGAYLLFLQGDQFVRFDEEGTVLDNYFSTASTNGVVRELIVRSDGQYLQLTKNFLIRLTEDGVLDNYQSISSFSFSNDNFYAMDTSSNDEIWCYGTSTLLGLDTPVFYLVGLDSAGAQIEELDLGETTAEVNYLDILVRADGTLLLVGSEYISSLSDSSFPSWYAASTSTGYRSFVEWRSPTGELLDRWEFGYGENTGIKFMDAQLLADQSLMITGASYLNNHWDQYLLQIGNDFFVDTDDLPEASNFHSQVVPNPGSVSLVYMLNSPGAGRLILRAFDFSGRLVHLREENITVGRQEFRLDTSSWPRGAYLLRASLDDGTPVALDRWIKQ